MCGPTTHRRAFSDSASCSFRRTGPTPHRGDGWRRGSLLTALGRSFALVPPLAASAGRCPWVRGKPRKLAGKDALRCPTSEIGLDSPAMLPTRGAGENLHHSASHVSVLADIRGGDVVAEERPSGLHDALSVRNTCTTGPALFEPVTQAYPHNYQSYHGYTAVLLQY